MRSCWPPRRAAVVAACCWAACLLALLGCGRHDAETKPPKPPPPVPAYPGSAYMTDRPYAEGRWKEYECPSSPEEVARWYAAGQGGWAVESQRQEGNVAVFRMTAGEGVAEVLVEPKQDKRVATLISTRVLSAGELEREGQH